MSDVILIAEDSELVIEVEVDCDECEGTGIVDRRVYGWNRNEEEDYIECACEECDEGKLIEAMDITTAIDDLGTDGEYTAGDGTVYRYDDADGGEA